MCYLPHVPLESHDHSHRCLWRHPDYRNKNWYMDHKTYSMLSSPTHITRALIVNPLPSYDWGILRTTFCGHIGVKLIIPSCKTMELNTNVGSYLYQNPFFEKYTWHMIYYQNQDGRAHSPYTWQIFDRTMWVRWTLDKSEWSSRRASVAQ